MERLAESIGYLLDDIAIEECTFRPTAEELESTGVGADFTNTCRLLLTALGTYNSNVKSVSSNCTIEDICEGFKALNPPFKLQQVRESRPELLQYRILHFLCTTLQSERLSKHVAKSGARFESAGERGKIVFQLDKICSDLRVDVLTGPLYIHTYMHTHIHSYTLICTHTHLLKYTHTPYIPTYIFIHSFSQKTQTRSTLFTPSVIRSL